jgi:hypothetical protein
MPGPKIGDAHARRLYEFAFSKAVAAKKMARLVPDQGIPAAEQGAGARKGKAAFVIQTLLFPQADWTLRAARAWCRQNGYHNEVDTSGTYYRFRQRSPEIFKFLRTITLGHSSIKAVGGRVK